MHCVILEKTKILALTATATSEVLHTVKTSLNLVDPLVLGLPPNRDNIKYYVEPLPKLEILCQLLCEGLNQLRDKFPKTLIFCHSIAECATIYKAVRSNLGRSFTEPPGYPDYHCFRLLDMYTRACSDDMKAKVLESFMKTDGRLRIVIATMAFSMGVDCLDIKNVVHYGPPNNAIQYVQETGRVGRSGIVSTALLLYGKQGNLVDQAIVNYGTNMSQCRSDVLFKNFLFYETGNCAIPKCNCCDICERTCNCVNCLSCVLLVIY